jgi:hypothetical protein
VLSEKELEERLNGIKSTGETSKCWEVVEGLIYFWHDQLDRAHSISQDIKSVEGSILHGMVHRREPDYSNAKYWFSRARGHPYLGCVADETRGIFEANSHTGLGARLMADGRWNPIAFVDFCEEVQGQKTPEATKEVARRLQAAEIRGFRKWLLGQG